MPGATLTTPGGWGAARAGPCAGPSARPEDLADERPRRRPGVDVERAATLRPPSGVGEHHAEDTAVQRRRVADLGRATQPERREVRRGDRDAQRVEVDAGHVSPARARRRRGRRRCRSRGRRTEAGAAAATRAARCCGDPAPRGLLEALGGELHRARRRPNFGRALRPQARLGQRRGDARGRRPMRRRAVPARDRVGAVRERIRRPAQQALARRRRAASEGLEVHPGSLAAPVRLRTAAPTTRGTRWHSLWGEC